MITTLRFFNIHFTKSKSKSFFVVFFWYFQPCIYKTTIRDSDIFDIDISYEIFNDFDFLQAFAFDFVFFQWIKNEWTIKINKNIHFNFSEESMNKMKEIKYKLWSLIHQSLWWNVKLINILTQKQAVLLKINSQTILWTCKHWGSVIFLLYEQSVMKCFAYQNLSRFVLLITTLTH